MPGSRCGSPGYGWIPFDPTPGRGTFSTAVLVRVELERDRRGAAARDLGRRPQPTRAGSRGTFGSQRPGQAASDALRRSSPSGSCCSARWVVVVGLGRPCGGGGGISRAIRVVPRPRPGAELEGFLRDQGVAVPRSATLDDLERAVAREARIRRRVRSPPPAARARFGPPAARVAARRGRREELRALLAHARRTSRLWRAPARVRLAALAARSRRGVSETYDLFQQGRSTSARDGRAGHGCRSRRRSAASLARARFARRSASRTSGSAAWRRRRQSSGRSSSLRRRTSSRTTASARSLVNQGSGGGDAAHQARALAAAAETRRRSSSRACAQSCSASGRRRSRSAGTRSRASARALLVLLGVARGRHRGGCGRLAGKVAACGSSRTRRAGSTARVVDAGGAALVVSQFTLIADTLRATARASPTPPTRACGAPLRALLRGLCARRRAGGGRRVRRAHGGRARQRRPGHDRARG